MELTEAQFALLKPYLPRQRGNVVHQSLSIINAVLWLAEHDCKWAALPSRFGDSHAIYVRVNRWNKAGVLDRLFEQMQRLQLIRLKLEVVGAGADALKSEHAWAPAPPAALNLTSGLPKFAWVPRIRICHRRLEAARRRSAKEQLGKRTHKSEALRPVSV